MIECLQAPTQYVLLNDVSVGEHSRIRNCIIDKHNVIPPNTVIGYDRAEDEKHYQIFPLDEHSWLTVIPKNRHSHQLELKKTLETSDPKQTKEE